MSQAAVSGRAAFLLLAIAVGGAFGATLGFDFVWDDRPLIVENPGVQSVRALGEAVTSSYWETGDRHDRFRAFFRPLVTLSFGLDHAVWGLRAGGFHLTNLLLHLAAAWLVRCVALSRGLGPGAALASALVFAAHPAHVESVAWVSGRTDLLAAVGLLAALLAERRGFRALGAAAFGAALLAKEVAAPFVVFVAVERALETKGGARGRIGAAMRAAWPYGVVLMAFLLVRRAALGSPGEPLYRLDAVGWCATAVYAIARYLGLWLVPAGLDPHHPDAPLADAGSTLVLVSAVFLAAAAWVLWHWSRRRPEVGRWALWGTLTLVPVLAFGRFGDVILADRYLYVPSIGLAMLAGLIWLELAPASGRGRVAAGFVLGVVVAALGARAAIETRVWRDDVSLFSRAARTSPESALVRCNLGIALYRTGRLDEAIDELRTATLVESGYALAHNNLGAALERAGRPDEALAQYRRAIEGAPRMVEARANAGHLLVVSGRSAEGLSLLRGAVREFPRSAVAAFALASALDQLGGSEEALALATRAVALAPSHAQAWYLRGKLLWEAGRRTEAADAMRRFLDLWSEPGEHRREAERISAARTR